MTRNNPKLDLVNGDVHKKFGQILSIRSKDGPWDPLLLNKSQNGNAPLLQVHVWMFSHKRLSRQIRDHRLIENYR